MHAQDDHHAGERAWQLARLRVAALEARALVEQVIDGLETLDVDTLAPGERVAIDPARLRHALEAAVDAQEVAEALGMIAEALLSDGQPAVLSVDALAERAAATLRDGTGHVGTLTLCARLLDCARGFPALADALASEPALAARWDGLSVGGLLGCFRDVDGAVVRRACLTAAVDPDDRWPDLEPDAIARLADALRATAA